MVNQKLLDYVGQQLKNGVSSSAISSALLGAGWSQSDVSTALDQAQSVSSGTPFAVTPASASTTAGGTVASFVSSPITSTGDIIRTESTSNVGKISAQQSSGSVFSSTTTSSTDSMHRSIGAIIGYSVLGILVVGFGGLSGYLYQQNQGLMADLVVARTGGDSMSASAQMLQKSADSLNAQNMALKAQVDDLTNQLAVFAPGTGSASDAQVSGALSVNGAGVYSVTGSTGIVYTVKNSKDSKVAGVLGGLVGSSVTIAGTHTPGSPTITVISVNGNLL
jgi:hypothetical protein